MREEFFLSRDCMVSIEEKPLKKLFLVNPEEVMFEKISDVKARILSAMGKFEVENFVIDRLYYIVTHSIIEQCIEKRRARYNNSGRFIADISEFAASSIHLFFRDEPQESIRNTSTFLNLILALPIFEVIEEQKESIFLRFVK